VTATIADPTHLTGQMIIAGALVTGTGAEIRGFDPAAGTAVEPGYRYGDAGHVDAACAAAADAFPVYRATTSEQRAQFLEAVAANLEAIKAALVARAVTESGLPDGRPRW
jgi:NADP-dependent aldehyde dehydrogenase